MVKIKMAGTTAQAGGEDRALAQFVEHGNLLPVISGQAIEDLVFGAGGHDRLVASYATHVGYPMPDKGKLHKVAKYNALHTGWKARKLKEDYLDQVANSVAEAAMAAGVDKDLMDEVLAQAGDFTVTQFACHLGFPRFDKGQDDPLLLLADLPLAIYLTTSPYTFIEEALRYAGKDPKSELCPWRPEFVRADSVFAPGGQAPAYEPSPQQPLVFHLFGIDAQPESIVLTEDDYLDFLAAVSQGRGKDQGVDPIPDAIKGAVQQSALLLLGFNLATWTFRSLYRGLIQPMPSATMYERYCCVQLVPNPDEKLYLEQYLREDARFDQVYWEPVDVFCQRELRR